MTNAEAKDALIRRIPVIFKNIEYSYISAIIDRYDKDDNLRILVELTDKNGQSVTIAQLKDVIKSHD